MAASSTKKHTPALDVPAYPHPAGHTRLFGHADILNTLRGYDGAMPNGLMLYGERGIGKATLGYRVIREFLGARDPENPADPVCMKIRAGSCPDLYVLEPKQEKSAKTATITVKAVRAAGEFMQYTSSDSGRKCVMIDAADDMNGNAQNALLKMLEEPSGDALFVLIAHHAGAILPTIRSRCRALYVPPPAEAEALQVLRICIPDASDTMLTDACRAAGNSAGRAAAFLRSGVMTQSRYFNDIIRAAAQGDRAAAEQGLERVQLPAGSDDMWRHLIFILMRTLSDAAAGREGTLRIPAEKAEYYYDRLCRLVRECDRVYLDRKTVLFNVFC